MTDKKKEVTLTDLEAKDGDQVKGGAANAVFSPVTTATPGVSPQVGGVSPQTPGGLAGGFDPGKAASTVMCPW